MLKIPTFDPLLIAQMPKLSASEFLVYCAIGQLEQLGQAPTRAAIATRAGVTPKTATKCIKSLGASGFIAVYNKKASILPLEAVE